ncbi:MAG: hypothetical protein HC925_05495 [Coleofasciculaceae cyanobacterium SM2_3_26]|nr:hypothetical protein [Coleofasciculaceae cyanobacterium SM2_3_26]
MQQMMQLARSPSTDVRSAPAIVLVEAGIPVGVVTASDVLRWVVVEYSSSGARSVAHSMVRTAPAVLPSAGYRDLFDLLPLFQERAIAPLS